MAGDETAFMSRALRLAACGRHASPNPMVGCVIVSPSGKIVGEGFHPQAGEPHAEVFALRMAGDQSKGATAYVTLEPCAHHGRTPPCADALIAAGVRRVVVALEDPDKRVAGKGVARLTAAGLAVDIGVCAEQTACLNAAYLKQRRTGTPYVTTKIAMTLDGRIATSRGDSKWITSAITRKWVHRQLRDRTDVIMVGVGTVITDDPSLTTRLTHKRARNPVRVIVDSHARSPIDSKIVQLAASDGKTWIAHTEMADQHKLSELKQAGVKLIRCTTDNRDSNYKNRNTSGRVSLPDLFSQLGTRGDVLGVLVEGGGELIGSLLQDGLVDRYIVAIAPKIVGGWNAPGPVGVELVGSMSKALEVVRWNWRRSGPDIIVDARLR
jgi:diaminohydroxyphosphoribosylaminopyrimidine deaminase/5-amino-6-(5-phosphoribosylamino)uracil reductase